MREEKIEEGATNKSLIAALATGCGSASCRNSYFLACLPSLAVNRCLPCLAVHTLTFNHFPSNNQRTKQRVHHNAAPSRLALRKLQPSRPSNRHQSGLSAAATRSELAGSSQLQIRLEARGAVRDLVCYGVSYVIPLVFEWLLILCVDGPAARHMRHGMVVRR